MSKCHLCQVFSVLDMTWWGHVVSGMGSQDTCQTCAVIMSLYSDGCPAEKWSVAHTNGFFFSLKLISLTGWSSRRFWSAAKGYNSDRRDSKCCVSGFVHQSSRFFLQYTIFFFISQESLLNHQGQLEKGNGKGGMPQLMLSPFHFHQGLLVFHLLQVGLQ